MTNNRPDYRASAIGMLEDAAQSTSITAQQTMIASAQVFATLALVEEQRTANLIAADAADLLASPYEVGTPEHRAYWQAHTAALADRLPVQR